MISPNVYRGVEVYCRVHATCLKPLVRVEFPRQTGSFRAFGCQSQVSVKILDFIITRENASGSRV